jgi:hypothetical protein
MLASLDGSLLAHLHTRNFAEYILNKHTTLIEELEKLCPLELDHFLLRYLLVCS